jgi:uncharacterized membrane protein
MCAAAALETLGLTKNRLEALSDGIFATLMTVLVLGLALPTQNVAGQTSLSIFDRIWMIRENILVYGLSFLVLGIYWVGHHNMFHYVRRTTRGFLWVNILFLMSVGIIPFSTTVYGADIYDHEAVVFYGGNLMLASLFLFTIWWYSTRYRQLTEKNLDPHLIRSVDKRILTGPLIFLIGIGVGYVYPVLSILVFLAAIIYFILPGHIDIHFTRKEHGHEGEE